MEPLNSKEANVGRSDSNAGLGALLITWGRDRVRKKNIMRPKKRLWAANYTVLCERLGFHSKKNKEFYAALEGCSDPLERTICNLKKHIGKDSVLTGA